MKKRNVNQLLSNLERLGYHTHIKITRDPFALDRYIEVSNQLFIQELLSMKKEKEVMPMSETKKAGLQKTMKKAANREAQVKFKFKSKKK